MRNKLLVAGTLALAMTCTTVFSSITPAVVKQQVYLQYRHRQQKIVMTTFTAMQA